MHFEPTRNQRGGTCKVSAVWQYKEPVNTRVIFCLRRPFRPGHPLDMAPRAPQVSAAGPTDSREPGAQGALEQPKVFSPNADTRKYKLATEPHGYLADKLTTILRAIWQLGRGSPKRQASGTAEEEAAEAGVSVTTSSPALQGETLASASDDMSGFVQQLHHHERADQLQKPLTTTAKIRNAVVSTVEHALDEAAALQASLDPVTSEELRQFRQEAHRGPIITTAGGLPLDAGEQQRG